MNVGIVAALIVATNEDLSTPGKARGIDHGRGAKMDAVTQKLHLPSIPRCRSGQNGSGNFEISFRLNDHLASLGITACINLYSFGHLNITLSGIDDDFCLLAQGSLGLNHSIQIDGYGIRIAGGLDLG